MKELAPLQQQQAQQQQQPVRERQTIWQGVLEWIEESKNPNDPQKLTRHVPCQVSTNPKDREPDLKADSWPQKLIMQLMPKQLIGNIGGIYLKNSVSVLFHPQNCEALESLTEVMRSGFAGCIDFTSMSPTSACDIKVLILLYTSEKRAYLGFIPNDQTTFFDRLRPVIQQSKSSQTLIRQGQEENDLASDGSESQHTTPTTSQQLHSDDATQFSIYDESVKQFLSPKKKAKRSKTASPYSKHEEEAYAILQQTKKKDECTTYGEHVANELRVLQPRARTIVKHLINNVLYEGAMGKYDNANMVNTPNMNQNNDSTSSLSSQSLLQ